MGTKTENKRTIVCNSYFFRLNSVMGMAVDWIGENLYWTDEGLRAIFVANLRKASKRATLVSNDLIHPRSIVVDSINGLMYWSNWPPGPPLDVSTVTVKNNIYLTEFVKLNIK